MNSRRRTGRTRSARNSAAMGQRENAIIQIIRRNPYIRTYEIAARIGINPGAVSRAMHFTKRFLHVGIHTTSAGHVLSTAATRRDDVNHLSRLETRRRNDHFTLTASEPFIRRRWGSNPQDVRDINIVFSTFGNITNLAVFVDAHRILFEKSISLIHP